MNISLIIFFTVFSIISFLRKDYALFIIAILLPSYLVRFQLFSIPLTVLEMMILILFVFWLLEIFSKKSDIKKISFPWLWMVLFFILAGTIAVFVSPDTRQALGLWKAYIIEPVLLYLIFVNTIRNSQQIKLIIFGLGMSVVFVSLIAIWQYIGLVDIPGGYGLESPMRATSVFPFPTAVGKFVGPIMGLFLGIALVYNTGQYDQKQREKNLLWRLIFIWGVILFGFIALVFSFSRAALVGVFAGIVFISLFSRWRKILLIAMSVIILLVFVVPVTRESVLKVFNFSDTSADVHLVMWKGAVRIIKDNPITGTGLASFPVVYDRYKEASHTEYFPNPDHLILTLWIEMGLIGLLVFIWLIIKYFKSGIRMFSINRGLSVALMASMIIILIHGLFDTPYFKNDLSAMFWLLIGLLVVFENNKDRLNTGN